MVHEVLSPRVKNGNEPGLHPETLTRKFRERLGGGFEKDVIENLPVSQGKGIELVRQGEDDMEVLNGEELFPPCLDPLLFPQELTLRAVPVPARVVGYLEVAALLALVDVSPQRPAVLQISMACMARRWFRGSLWASRYEGPYLRKTSATSAWFMEGTGYFVSRGLVTRERLFGLT
jgi:hypothetical protein